MLCISCNLDVCVYLYYVSYMYYVPNLGKYLAVILSHNYLSEYICVWFRSEDYLEDLAFVVTGAIPFELSMLTTIIHC
jgi:hypothetical protein